jgi:hypothetical protein
MKPRHLHRRPRCGACGYVEHTTKACPGATFIAGLPEGAVLELRAGSYPWLLPPGVPRVNAKFTVRRKT